MEISFKKGVQLPEWTDKVAIKQTKQLAKDIDKIVIEKYKTMIGK